MHSGDGAETEDGEGAGRRRRDAPQGDRHSGGRGRLPNCRSPRRNYSSMDFHISAEGRTSRSKAYDTAASNNVALRNRRSGDGFLALSYISDVGTWQNSRVLNHYDVNAMHDIFALFYHLIFFHRAVLQAYVGTKASQPLCPKLKLISEVGRISLLLRR